MKNFWVRLVSGVSVAALFIAAILFSHISYGIAILVAGVGSVYEFYTISPPIRIISEGENKRSRTRGMILAAGCVLLSLILNSLITYPFADMGVVLPTALFLYFVWELFSRSEKPFHNIAWDILPIVYIVIPVMLLNYLCFHKGELFALSILFMVWFYDSMCYICGSLVGHTKLIERISPKKTVEGLAGGMVLTLVLAYYYNDILDFLGTRYGFHYAVYAHWQWLIIGFVTLVFATLGDLVESQLKRNIGIKDSGAILPGHGGFLDRLDAVLVAIPFTVLTLFILDHAGKM